MIYVKNYCFSSLRACYLTGCCISTGVSQRASRAEIIEGVEREQEPPAAQQSHVGSQARIDTLAHAPRFQDISVLRLPAIVGISRTIDCCRDTQFLSWIAQLPHHDQTLQQSKADNRSPFSFMHDQYIISFRVQS